MMTAAEKDLIRKCTAELSEHFENVQVFVNSHDGNGEKTNFWHDGAGNIFARIGQIHDWMERQSQYTRTSADVQQREDLQSGE